MTRCPRAHCGGQVMDDDGRAVCLLCGYIAREPEPGLLEKIASNAKPQEDERHATLGPRQESKSLADIKARVMARLRAEVRG